MAKRYILKKIPGQFDNNSETKYLKDYISPIIPAMEFTTDETEAYIFENEEQMNLLLRVTSIQFTPVDVDMLCC